MIKDFFEFIIKGNIISNFIILKFGHLLISKSNTNNLKKYPLTNKSNYRSFKPQTFFYIKGYSSGTTNEPLTIYRSIKSVILEEYFVKSYYFSKTKIYSPRYAVLRGEYIINEKVQKPPFWKIKPFTGKLILSSIHLSDKNIIHYLRKLENFKPDIIHAYPNAILLVAKKALQLGWKLNWNLKSVFTGSETFKKSDKVIVKKVFKNVFDIYGQAERVAMFFMCKNFNYHVGENYSKVEFIKDKLDYKIIGTNLDNKSMQFIRYDTGDRINSLPKNNCKCGIKGRFVKSIKGRKDDNIYLPDGRVLTRMDVAFKGVTEILEAQIIQKKINLITINYVLNNNFEKDKTEQKLKKIFTKYFGRRVLIKIYMVKKIHRDKSGKFRSVKNLMKKDEKKN